MLQSWRWFRPKDPISLTKIRPARAQGIVTALHDIPAGELWPRAAIAELANLVEEGRVLEGDIADLSGHPWLGRLEALAELRGMLHAIEQLT